MDKYMEAEKELAELLGWKELRKPSMHNKNWLGISPDDNPNSEFGYSPYVPLWCSDSAAAFDLMVEQELKAEVWKGCAWIGNSDEPEFQCEEIHDDHGGSAQMAMRYAIVKAVIAKLKRQ